MKNCSRMCSGIDMKEKRLSVPGSTEVVSAKIKNERLQSENCLV